MPCGKVYEKLWNNYLNKYGDFRERLQTIRNDQQCFMQFQLPRIKQQSLGLVKKPAIDSNNRKFEKKCDRLLPSECCRSSITKNNLSFVLNKTDLDKLIEAENFPDNIFPVSTEPRVSIDNEIELSVTDNLHRLTSPMNSSFSTNNISHSIIQNDEESSMYSISNKIEKTFSFSHKSIQKSELVTSSHNPTASRITNPYAQLIDRLHKAEKTKFRNSGTKVARKSFDSPIDTNTHNCIQNFLSFLHSLDDTIDNKQNPFNEDTLIALFSVDNHLSSSIYISPNIHQLNVIPKPILHSLRNTSTDEHILNKIQSEKSRNKIKELNSNFRNITKQQLYSNNDPQTSNYIDQDKELNSRLFNTYTVKAFKDFLIHRNKSARLPKLFHDINQN